MIRYEIFYEKGQSPREREQAAENDINILLGQAAEKQGWILPPVFVLYEKVLSSTVKLLNELLVAPKGKNFFYEKRIFLWNDVLNYNVHLSKYYDSLNGLIDSIIPDLESLLNILSKRCSESQLALNTAVINELKQLKKTKTVNPVHFLKILQQFDVPGIKRIEFSGDNTGINQEILLDIEYPMELIPDTYLCDVMATVMTDPCMATNSATIDSSLVKSLTVNPFTRDPWPANIKKNNLLRNEINNFIRKVEWLYYSFQDNTQYKSLYHDSTVKDFLKKGDLDYVQFCNAVKGYVQTAPSTNYVIFDNEQRTLLPPKYILDLFSKNCMHVLLPTNKDYEKLIRRLGASGDASNLDRLLLSPFIESVKINVYARNEKNENVLEVINSFKSKHADLLENYDECIEVLATYQMPKYEDLPRTSLGILGSKVYNFLPVFNRQQALMTFASVVVAGAGIIYASSGSESKPSLLGN